MIILDELGGGGGRLRVVGGAVLDHQFDPAAQQPAGRIDLVHHQHRGVGLSAAHDGERSRLVGDHADLDHFTHDVAPRPRSGR